MEPHINCYGLRSAVVLLMILLASYDSNVSANGITKPKKFYCISFKLSWPKERSSSIGSAIGAMWCKCLPMALHGQKSYVDLILIILT